MSIEDTLARRWAEIDTLLDDLLGLPDDQRTEALERHCADDPELLEAARQLLRATQGGGDDLTAPGAEIVAAALDADEVVRVVDFRPGDEIGRYRIRGELGRGGMATVYEAERSDGAYQQVVALKVLRRGLDTDRIVERFLAERQILSDFAHPNVARLLDGGATEDGRPYLVMERVEGWPITEWAEEGELSPRERLRLFLQVTDAVSEAHRRLVVHRDIKPGNILVDGSGRVKLLDFGIAKLLDADADPALTEAGVRPLTQRYASPEQRRGGPITTSSDVYQLGLLLHELLTGRSPFDEGGALELDGDLKVIVATAMAEEPGDRYVAVEALAADVRRHLAGRPIEARPAPWWLRVAKWTRRNRWAPPVAALLVLGSAAYLATLYVGLDRLERERNTARAEAARAERIQGVLVDLFRSADPFAGPGGRPDLTVAEALAPAVDRIRADLSDDPVAQAEMLVTVASVLGSLERFDEGVALVEEALDIRRRLGDEGSPAVARDLQVLAAAIRSENWDSAGALLDRAIVILRQSVGADDPRLAAVLAERLWLDLTRFPPADPALGEEALAIYRAAGERWRAEAAGVLSHLAYVYSDAGDLDAAEAAAREAFEIQRSLGGDDAVATALAAVTLAGVLDKRVRYDEAVPLYRQALPVLEAAAGPDHNQTLTVRNNLATTYQQVGRFEEAVALHREILAAQERRAAGEPTLELGQSLQNLAAALTDLGELAEADMLAGRAHEVLVASTTDGHPVRAFPLLTQAEIRARRGDAPGAARAAQGALAILDGALPPDHYAIGVARCRLGAAWLRTGRADGRLHVTEALAILQADERTPPEYLAECEEAAQAAG